MPDLIECADCKRPIEYDDAEMIETGGSDGPKTVCETCFDTYYLNERDPMFNTYQLKGE